MTSTNLNLTESELTKACLYIGNQFTAHSWWPCEQPDAAKREFELMKSSATALNVWCERWLDTGQRQKLKKALEP